MAAFEQFARKVTGRVDAAGQPVLSLPLPQICARVQGFRDATDGTPGPPVVHQVGQQFNNQIGKASYARCDQENEYPVGASARTQDMHDQSDLNQVRQDNDWH
jgi:hypothetical protein